MSDEAALLAAIRANPKEDTPRLMYADWLDEHGGEAGIARAEFIRVQCEVANLYDAQDQVPERYQWLENRENELQSRYRKVWLAEFPDARIPKKHAFSRGFLSRVELNAKQCIGTSRPSWHREPLLTVGLSGTTADVKALCTSGWLDGVTDLNPKPDDASDANAIVEAITNSSCAQYLHRFHFRSDGCTDYSLLTIAKSRTLQLRSLSCQGRFTVDGWAALLNSPAANRLEWLDITHRFDTGAQDRPGSALAAVLVKSPAHLNLKNLWLDGCHLTGIGLTQLARDGRFTRLERLYISEERWSDQAFRALGEGTFPALFDLALTDCGLGDSDVGILVKSPLMAQLQDVSFFSNELTSASLEMLVACGQTQKLKVLELGFNRIGDNATLALMRSENFPALRQLCLSKAGLTDNAADAILNSPWAGQLHLLFLSYNDISSVKCKELQARFGPKLSLVSDREN